MKKLSKKRASAELDKILESVAKPKVKRAQEISKLKGRLNEQLKGAESTPGINLTNKVLKTGGKQNQDAMKAVADKLKSYLKYKFNSNPEFPHQNNSKTDYDSPMYRNNTDQEDYIDDWRGGGMTDLEYDTEPSKEFGDNFKKYLDGSSDKGNAQSNKDGDLGNVVSNKVGERIQKTLKRKHKKLQGDDGFAIPNTWTQHPNAGHIPKLSEAYEDDIDAEIEMEEEADYMGAPSQVEKRDTYDGRPGEVVGVYSNIKKQRDMKEDTTELEADLEEWEINLPFSQLRDVDLQHHGDNPLANMQLTSNPALNPEMLNFGHGGASDVNVVDGDVLGDRESWEGEDEEFTGDSYEDETFSSEMEDDENFDDVGNKSFDDIEAEGSEEIDDTLSVDDELNITEAYARIGVSPTNIPKHMKKRMRLNKTVTHDLKEMYHLMGYNKKTQ